MEDEISKLNDLIADQDFNYKQKNEELIIKQKDLNDKKAKIENLDAKLKTDELEYNTILKRLADNKAHINSLNRQLNQLKDESKETRNEFKEKAKSNKEKTENKRNVLHKKKDEYQKKSNDLKEFKEKKSNLEADLATSIFKEKEHASELDVHKNKIPSLQKNLDEINLEIDEVYNQIKEQKKKHLEDEKALNEQIRILFEKLRKLNKDDPDYSEINKKIEHFRNILSQNNKNFDEDQKIKQDKIKIKEKAKITKESLIIENDQKIVTLKEQLSKVTVSTKSYQTHLDNQKNLIKSTENSLLTINNELNTIEREYTKLMEENKLFDEDIIKLVKKKDDVVGLLDVSDKENLSLEADSVRLSKEIDVIKKDLEPLKKEVEAGSNVLSKDINNLQFSKEKNKEKLKNLIIKSEEISKNIMQTEVNQGDLKKAGQDKEKINDSNNLRKKDLEKTKQKNDQKLKECEGEYKTQVSEVKKLQEKVVEVLGKKDKEINKSKKLENDKNSFIKTHGEKKTNFDKAKQAKHDCEFEKREKLKQSDDLDLLIAQRQDIFTKLESEKDNYKSEVDNYSKELESLNIERRKAENKLEKDKTNLEQINKEYSELNNKKKRNEAKIQELQNSENILKREYISEINKRDDIQARINDIDENITNYSNKDKEKVDNIEDIDENENKNIIHNNRDELKVLNK